MSKKCARPECGKTVYPIEELKCLDKVWHKQCFKCTVCGMTLNMKNYKGYDKMPYCEPHYPKTVASVVVDTPEMRRLAENTRLQSQVKYHEEFEKSRGQKIEVADDPEVIRHLRNTQVQSQVAYHGDIDKKRHQDEIRPAPEQQQPPSPNGQIPPQQRQVGSIADYDPLNGNWGSVGSSRTAEKIGQNKNGQKVNTGNQVNAAAGKTSNQQVGGMNMGKRTSSTGLTVKALYDYTAADKDEVSFVEGDVIVNCQKVDEGWMTGTVQRTLKWGMLPANYVEVIKQPTGLHYLS